MAVSIKTNAAETGRVLNKAEIITNLALLWLQIDLRFTLNRYLLTLLGVSDLFQSFSTSLLLKNCNFLEKFVTNLNIGSFHRHLWRQLKSLTKDLHYECSDCIVQNDYKVTSLLFVQFSTVQKGGGMICRLFTESES